MILDAGFTPANSFMFDTFARREKFSKSRDPDQAYKPELKSVHLQWSASSAR